VAQSYGRLLHDDFENLSVSLAQICNDGAAMARGDKDVASVAAYVYGTHSCSFSSRLNGGVFPCEVNARASGRRHALGPAS